MRISLPMVEYYSAALQPYKAVATRPANPEIIEYGPYNEKDGYGYVMFNLPKQGVNGEYLNPKDMYYNLYLDDEKFVSYTDEYINLSEDMIDVPWLFSDGLDFAEGGEIHTVYLYTTGFEKVGIQSFYTLDNNTYSSNLVYYDVVEAGISPSTIEGKKRSVSGVVYHDLSGRRVVNSYKGIYVKTVSYADGSVKTFKVVKR